MLTRVEIENFKAIEKLTMDFTSRLTVIVGPNGSGKTSILQAIDSIRFDAIPSAYRRSGSHAEPAVRLQTSYGQSRRIPSEDSEDRRTGSLRVTVGSGHDTTSAVPSPPPFGAVFLRFLGSEMRQPSLGEGNPPPLNTDGSNLASVLSSLCLNQPQRFELIKSRLRDVIPQVHQLRFQRVRLHERDRSHAKPAAENGNGLAVGDQLLFDMQNAVSVPADAVSEGTLLALGIITAAVMADGQLAVLIDDLDASLHPTAQAELVRAIRSIETEQAEIQLIATSHSPYLLNALQFDEIRLTTLDDDGRVVCGRLSDHSDFERWKDEMTPGEMWGMWGESWLTKNRQEALQP